MNESDIPLAEGLAFLSALADDAAAPEEALERLHTLRGRHPGVALELIWEQDPIEDRPSYDLLITHPARGTVSLTLTPPSAVPFPLRSAQRWREAELVRVDGRSLWLYEAMVAIDGVWNEARILDRVVDLCILRRALEHHPVQVSDDELQRAVDDFRARRGLLTPEATEEWLARHGIPLAGLEGFVEEELAFAALRRRLVGDRAERAFAAAPSHFDQVALAAFPVASADDAEQLAAEVRGGTPFFAVAERALSAGRKESRAARSLLFETMRRADVAPLEPVEPPAELAAGTAMAARLGGAGPYVVLVRGVTPATWDEATREIVEQSLFAEWLAGERARAHVEWNWGHAE